MRLPLPLLNSQYFQFSSFAELRTALGDSVSSEELQEAARIVLGGLPPITSRLTLAAMLGVNPGLIWSFENRPQRYYRSFSIPKGRTTRQIDAPKVALKLIQKWLSVQLARTFEPADHVYGFVGGRSHVQAAARHVGAQWVFSLDIQDFFPSTPIRLVVESLKSLGFGSDGASLLSRLACLRGALAQGAPSSPILSNICFQQMDGQLAQIAQNVGARLTRYADDVVFSGIGEMPPTLENDVRAIFTDSPWTLAEHKIRIAQVPDRLKVHGLLVHGAQIRLTKGYRNRLRAYRHLLHEGKIRDDDLAKVCGHLSYAASVERESDGTS
ncbi:RNA-directed DNA polymerase [Burkholderia cepacia]|uniref:reverse transcriptase family protein n=1 Tax=Burkholderia cepacia TaxID=292 RepID=UPI001C2CCA2B|nr:reverse transcriptase family protein [Burkholderia cepacia]NTX43845.1 RNA-directed DNA polymerase [Burkholderia cepacia]